MPAAFVDRPQRHLSFSLSEINTRSGDAPGYPQSYSQPRDDRTEGGAWCAKVSIVQGPHSQKLHERERERELHDGRKPTTKMFGFCGESIIIIIISIITLIIIIIIINGYLINIRQIFRK